MIAMGLRVDTLYQGDNLEVLRREFPDESVNLAYLDPPFLTGKRQTLLDRTLSESDSHVLSFNDVWASHGEYLGWVRERLREVHRVLKPSGSIYLHCDWHASHLLRVELDGIFGADQFRAEVVWSYKRWTNAARTFQRAHQTIYFYSKTDAYTFCPQYEDYSFTTNLDQIWQRRGRAKNGKSITISTADGTYMPLGKGKPGVPMRDVWEIPFLNPRAKERTGWPTQKPLELLRRIILASTESEDIVLDPVCGSGTTLVAARSLGRRWVGIDSSEEAIEISRRRLASNVNPFAKDAHFAPYRVAHFLSLPRKLKVEHLAGMLSMHVVHRNANVDGLLKTTVRGANVPVRYLDDERPVPAVGSFVRAAAKMKSKLAIAIMPEASKLEAQRLEEMYQDPVRVVLLTYRDITKRGFKIERFLRDRQLALGLE